MASVRPDIALSTASWHQAFNCCNLRRIVPGSPLSVWNQGSREARSSQSWSCVGREARLLLMGWLICFRSRSSLRAVRHLCLSNSSRTGGTRTRQKDWGRLTFLVTLPRSRRYLSMLPLCTPPRPWLPSMEWRMTDLAGNRWAVSESLWEGFQNFLCYLMAFLQEQRDKWRPESHQCCSFLSAGWIFNTRNTSRVLRTPQLSGVAELLILTPKFPWDNALPSSVDPDFFLIPLPPSYSSCCHHTWWVTVSEHLSHAAGCMHLRIEAVVEVGLKGLCTVQKPAEVPANIRLLRSPQ